MLLYQLKQDQKLIWKIHIKTKNNSWHWKSNRWAGYTKISTWKTSLCCIKLDNELNDKGVPGYHLIEKFCTDTPIKNLQWDNK